MDIFGVIAERKIQDAIQEGVFDDLEGKGKLLVLENDTWVPEELRMTYRFLKNSGHIPPELEAKNEIISLRDLIETIDDDRERLKMIRKLNYQIMRFNMMRTRPLHWELSPDYHDRIVGKMVP